MRLGLVFGLLLLPAVSHAVVIVISDELGDRWIYVPNKLVPEPPVPADGHIDWLTTDPNPQLGCDDGWADVVIPNFQISGGHKFGDLAVATQVNTPVGYETRCWVKTASGTLVDEWFVEIVP